MTTPEAVVRVAELVALVTVILVLFIPRRPNAKEWAAIHAAQQENAQLAEQFRAQRTEGNQQ